MTDQRPTMTAAEFEAVCVLLFGPNRAAPGGGRNGWQEPAADFLKVNKRNVAYWAAEPPATCKPVPDRVRDELEAEVRRRLADPDELVRMGLWLARAESQTRAMRTALRLDLH